MSQRIYLDYAATTPLDDRVLEVMIPYLKNNFGNASSIHTHGREAKIAVEKARKSIAGIINAAPAEVFFTSGATESNNMALTGLIKAQKIKKVLTSPLEHHAVLHTLEYLQHQKIIDLELLNVDQNGAFSIDQIATFIESNQDLKIISLIHGNNEIGNIIDLQKISDLCINHNTLFHSDTVQTIGKYAIDVQKIKLDSLVGSAHKFYGPKGIGFVYFKDPTLVQPLIWGGMQERNLRGGTENVASIVGMAKALELAVAEMELRNNHILHLKNIFISELNSKIKYVSFNGMCNDPDQSCYHIINIQLPGSEDNEMLLFNLDINKISVSGGSACNSGANIGSHVLEAMKINPDTVSIRFSLGKDTSIDDIKYTISQLEKLTA